MIVFPGSSLQVGDLVGGRFRLESVVAEEHTTARLWGSNVDTGEEVTIEIFVGAVGAKEQDREEARRRFVQGAARAIVLDGPHVARVIDTGVTTDGHPFVVRQAVATRTLTSVLGDEGALDTFEAVHIAIEVCDAIAEAHSYGLIHGGISPRSVHLEWKEGKSRDVKVVDLGTAHAMHKAADIDARDDVAGVGALLYTMLSGCSPYGESGKLDEVASLAGVPAGLAELAERCLSSDPRKRPPSMLSLVEGLARFGLPARVAHTIERLRERDSTPTLLVLPDDYEELSREAEDQSPVSADFMIPIEVTAPMPPSMPALPKDLLPKVVAEAPQPAPAHEAPKKTAIQSFPPVVLTAAPAAREVPTLQVRAQRARSRRLAIAAIATSAALAALGVFALRSVIAPPQHVASSAPPVVELVSLPPAAESPPVAEPAAVPVTALPTTPETAARVERAAAPAPATPAMGTSRVHIDRGIAIRRTPSGAIVASSAKRDAAKNDDKEEAPPAQAPAAPAAPAHVTEPAAAPKAAPAPPPKATDDELRTFLDDRR